MTITRIVLNLLLVATVATAQSLKPDVAQDIDNARIAFKALTPADRAISCSDTTQGAVIAANPRLSDFCRTLRNVFDPNATPGRFSRYILQKQELSQFFEMLASAAESRLDVHNGSNPTGSGTTNAAVRGGISNVLGLALEHGAMTQSVSGSTLTLNANVLSLYRFALGQSPFNDCEIGAAKCTGSAILNSFSGSASLNLSNPTSQAVAGTVAGTGSATPQSASALIQSNSAHLTAFTVRYQIHSSLDLRSKTYLAAWGTAIAQKNLTDLSAQAVTALDAAFLPFTPAVGPAPTPTAIAYSAWFSSARASVEHLIRQDAPDGEVQALVLTEVSHQWNALYASFKSQGLTLTSIREFAAASNAYLLARNAALSAIRQKLANSVSVEYTFSRPPSQPRLSTLRLAYTLHPGTASDAMAASRASDSSSMPNDLAITFNAATDFYDNPPPGLGTFRDVQAAVQLDRHFGTAVGTLAAYYQYQHQPAAILIGAGNLAPNTNIVLPGPAATLLAPKGNMVVLQAGVAIVLKNGAKIPVSVTWSNRTELIKASEVRGHVGFTFDWSSLLLRAKQ